MAIPRVTQSYPSGRWSGKTATTLFFSGAYDHPLGRKLAQYQVRVYRVSDGVEFWNSGIVAASAAEITHKRFTIGYNVDTGGTALVYDTEYQWKVRVWDEDGKRTVFTGLMKFTPLDMPAIPTALRPKQDFVVIADTGGNPDVDIEGSFSHPEGATITGFQYKIRKQGETDLTYDSGLVSTVSASFSQTYGTANSNDTPASPPDLAWDTVYEYAVRTRDNSGDATTQWSRYSDWIAFKTASPPKPPTLSGPFNGAVLFNTTPTLGWVYEQGKHGSGNQTSAIVSVYLEEDNSLVYNSPATLNSEATTYRAPAHPLTVGKRYKWNVKNRGYAGPGYSQLSEWGAFFIAALVTLTITSPTQAEVLTVPTFDLEFEYTGAFDLVVYQVRLFRDQALTDELYDSGPIVAKDVLGNNIAPGQDVVHTLEAERTGVLDGTSYWAKVYAFDEHGQGGISSTRKFTINYTPPATITGVSATPNV